MHPVLKLLLAGFLLALNLYGAARLYPPGRWREKLGVFGGGCAVVVLLITVLRACYPGTGFWHVPILSVGPFTSGRDGGADGPGATKPPAPGNTGTPPLLCLLSDEYPAVFYPGHAHWALVQPSYHPIPLASAPVPARRMGEEPFIRINGPNR